MIYFCNLIIDKLILFPKFAFIKNISVLIKPLFDLDFYYLFCLFFGATAYINIIKFTFKL